MTAWMLAGLVVAGTPLTRIHPQTELGQSQGVVVTAGSLLHTGPIFPDGPAEFPTPPADQVRQLFARLQKVLQSQQSGWEHLAKLNVYVAHPSVTPLVQRELKAIGKEGLFPAVSFVQSPQTNPAIMVAADAVALLPDSTAKKVVLISDAATARPAGGAVLPAGSVAYISGQAEKGRGPIASATRATLVSLFQTLQFLGASPGAVAQVKVFTTDMGSAAVVEEEIASAFAAGRCPPVIQVQWISTLPVEIELVVALPHPGRDGVDYLTPPAMTTSPVFARVAVIHSPQRVYFSGLYGHQEDPDGVEEVRDLFRELQQECQAAGTDLRHLAKATYYVTSSEVSRHLGDVRPEFYDPQRPPAASRAMVLGTGRIGRHITLDMIAAGGVTE